MLLADLVETARLVTESPGRRDKIEHIAALVRRLPPDEIGIGVAYLTGSLRQGRFGLGPALVSDLLAIPPAPSPTLTLASVNDVFEHLQNVTGRGSGLRRRESLRHLFAHATVSEQGFLARLVLGELRQGALEGIMVEALARATRIPLSALRRAHMICGDLATVGQAVVTEGASGLQRFRLELFHPLRPMLAQTARNVNEALARLGHAAFEYKLDGARIQAHKLGAEVRVFTRRLNDVTPAVPELVEAVGTLPAKSLILDGETLVMKADGTPRPFQITMRRFGRRLNIGQMRRQLPLSMFFFDCLHLDGKDLIDLPLEERCKALDRAVPASTIVRRIITDDRDLAANFLSAALAQGHEGVMAKSLTAPYQAGNRGSAWLKVKPVNTLDLVVLAAEWGHGRRRGWLSNLHLGARSAEGGFVMLGKTFKGMTDAMLRAQTKELLALEIARDRYTVYVRPELVVEVAFNGIQSSPQYPGGLALRFARIKSYRRDKRAEDADSMRTVRAIYADQSA